MVTNISSIDELKSIHDNSFPLPDIKDVLYFSKKLISDNGDLIAAGLVKLTCEGILIIDEKQLLATKIRAIKELIRIQSEDARKIGLHDCHVFTKKEKMRVFLRHLGWTDLNGEFPMMIKL